jgi:hypothetical protein
MLHYAQLYYKTNERKHLLIDSENNADLSLQVCVALSTHSEIYSKYIKIDE